MNSPRSGTEWLKVQRAQAANATPPAPPACHNEEAVDSQVERFLQENGVRYAAKTQIPIDLVDEKASQQNQARDVPIVPESVERFAASLRKGEYLPPIVVFPNGTRVVIVDGNNRFVAHRRAGSRFVPGFVIAEDTPSETIALLTVAANNGHGVTPDLAWRKRQAAHLVSVGFGADKACEAAGVTKTQLGDFQALARADAKAKQLKLPPTWYDLPATVRIHIGRMPWDAVFYQAARCAIDTAMDSETARIMLKDVKALGSENDQVSFIAELAEKRRLEAKARSATGATNRVSSPKQSLITAIGKIMHINSAELARQTLTDMDRQLIVRRINECVDTLGELEAALAASSREARDAG